MKITLDMRENDGACCLLETFVGHLTDPALLFLCFQVVQALNAIVLATTIPQLLREGMQSYKQVGALSSQNDDYSDQRLVGFHAWYRNDANQKAIRKKKTKPSFTGISCIIPWNESCWWNFKKSAVCLGVAS